MEINCKWEWRFLLEGWQYSRTDLWWRLCHLVKLLSHWLVPLKCVYLCCVHYNSIQLLKKKPLKEGREGGSRKGGKEKKRSGTGRSRTHIWTQVCLFPEALVLTTVLHYFSRSIFFLPFPVPFPFSFFLLHLKVGYLLSTLNLFPGWFCVPWHWNPFLMRFEHAVTFCVIMLGLSTRCLWIMFCCGSSQLSFPRPAGMLWLLRFVLWRSLRCGCALVFCLHLPLGILHNQDQMRP